MNQAHLPRSLVILLFILVAATFFVGILRSFMPAHAAVVLDNLTSKVDLSAATSNADFPSPGPTPTPPPAAQLPTPIGENTSLPTPAPTVTNTMQADGELSSDLAEEPLYISDMTGIIALGILMVVVVLVGVAWSGRVLRKKT
jgi:hypothetical protein